MDMKKLFLAVLVIVSACTSQDMIVIEETLSKNTNERSVLNTVDTLQVSRSSIRNFNEALQVAQSSIAKIESSTLKRTASPRRIDFGNTKILKANTSNRSANNTSDTLMYVFNFEENQGFAIVSADKNIIPLLAVTESGNYDPDMQTGIEGFDYYMEQLKNQLLRGPQNPTPIPGDFFDRDSIAYEPNYSLRNGPFLSVRWGQQYPEGEACPNGLCGCTNTAIAQIMSYYEYPDSISITCIGSSPFIQTLNWQQMKNHSTGHSYYYCPTPTVHSSIFYLLRQLGQMNNSIYGYDSYLNPFTGTEKGPVISTMTNLGYSTGNWEDFNFPQAKSQLDSLHLLLMAGLQSFVGHMWVFDGYMPVEKINYHLSPIGIDGAYIITEVINMGIAYYYCHYNWGYYGICNGYFLPGVFSLNNASVYDQPGSNNIQENYNIEVSFLPIYHCE